MSGIIRTKREIQSQLSSVLFVEQTCSQINKDLLGISEVFVTSDNLLDNEPMEGLTNQLLLIFESFNGPEKLSQFIYKVDLPEMDFQEALSKGDWNNLAFLVIRREAQKVYLKNMFR